MLPIEIFYHVYAPQDQRHSCIYLFLDEQLSLVEKYGLSEMAKVNVCVTLPMEAYQGNFLNHIGTYLAGKYPFARIIDVRDLGAPNIYEGSTLSKLYQSCLSKDIFVLYIHTKGSSNSAVNIHLWRQILNHFCICDWGRAINALREGYDIAGVKDWAGNGSTVSGNIWWSKSSYIRTLPDPLRSDLYSKEIEKWPYNSLYRYAFEDWYWLNSPKAFYLADTKINHYDNIKFIGEL